jgi:hypothetical protein
VALSAARMKEWTASNVFGLDLLVIQIDGIHMKEDIILVAAIGVDARGDKHPLGLVATQNAASRSSPLAKSTRTTIARALLDLHEAVEEGRDRHARAFEQPFAAGYQFGERFSVNARSPS